VVAGAGIGDRILGALQAKTVQHVAMNIPSALIEDLTLLSAALDGPVGDLDAVLAVFNDHLAAAIPSYLGLTVALHIDEQPVVVNTLDTKNLAQVRTSLLLPLQPLGAATTTGSVTLFSGVAGAFVDLADNARWIFNLNGHPVLDSDLTTPS